MNHRPWINFKELRARLQFEDVLRHYKVQVNSKGEQHHSVCPLPGHTGKNSAPSFSANLKRGIFQCFGCGAKGNVLEFAAFMEHVDAKNGEALREVAVKLQERFFPQGASSRKRAEPVPEPSSPPPAPAQTSLPIFVNEPIDFELKGLDRNHEWFGKSGIKVETAQHFGVGHCSRGLLTNRIAIPLHNSEAKLLGYAGRSVTETAISEENPLFLYPTRREREGKVFDFDQSLILYNSHRIKPTDEELVIVQDIVSVWWLYQCGIPKTVGLTVRDLSEAQTETLLTLAKPGCRIWILTDGDREGGFVAQSLLRELAPHRFVRWVKIAIDERPYEVPENRLWQYLTG